MRNHFRDKLGVVHLLTGDMLRVFVAVQTEVGKLAKDFMDSGKLVPDDVIIGVVRRYMASANQSRGSNGSKCVPQKLILFL